MTPPKIPANYRKLRGSEVLREGDKFWAAKRGRWLLTKFVGLTVEDAQPEGEPRAYVRRLAKAK